MSKSQRSKTRIKPADQKASPQKGKLPFKINANNWITIGLVAVVTIIIGVLLYRQNSHSLPKDFPIEISVSDAYAKYQEGVFFLDVRTQEEWVDYHAPNTTLIPLDQLESRLSELPRDREIVVVCRSGNRSQEGRDILLSAGFSPVSSMVGGLNQWRSAGYPIVSGP